MLKRVVAQLNSKINGPFFVIVGCIQALKLFLSSIATDGQSGRRKLKLENDWPHCSNCYVVPGIITIQIVKCSSRKYPYPHLPPRRAKEIPRGEKVRREGNFRGGGELLSKVGSNYGKALGTLTRARTDFWRQT